MCSAKHIHLHQMAIWQTSKHQQKYKGRKIERKYTRNSKNETLEAKMKKKEEEPTQPNKSMNKSRKKVEQKQNNTHEPPKI